MKTNPKIGPALPRHPTVHEPEEISVWSLAIEADSEPLLVARVLQKLAVPEIEVLGLNFSWGEQVSFVRLHLRCRGALARLGAAKLRRLVKVREVRLS